MRFINHGINFLENVSVEQIFLNCKKITCFYAKKSIRRGEELYFDYGTAFNTNWK